MTDCAAKGIVRATLGLVLVAGLLQVPTGAQDRLKGMPGYQQYQKMVSSSVGGVFESGALNADWSADGGSFEYTVAGKRYKYDLAAKSSTEIGPAPDPGAGRGGRGGRGGAPGVERGRQAVSADSPDGKLKAVYKDRNLWLTDAAGANPVAITTDGSEVARIKYGTASWVYGEELGQRTAMWWSPDSSKIAYYRFDEKQVPDYILQMDQTQIQSKADVEAYPKAGAPNPIVELFVYDVATKKTTKIDVRDGKPFDNSVVGHYVYRVAWSPDGTELLFNRTNRRQNIARVRRRQSADGRDTGHRPRRMADGLGHEQPGDAVPERQQALHLGVRAERLGEPLPLRSERQADRAADEPHDVRSGRDREGRRGGRRGFLHRAQRRQPHEDAAAPRRSRRQG